MIQTFVFLYLCIHLRKPGCKIMRDFCPGPWNTTSVHFFSPPLPPHCCCMKHHKPLEPGILPLYSATLSAGFPLLCPSGHQCPCSSQADPQHGAKESGSMLRRLSMEDQIYGVQSFPAFLCDPEPTINTWFHSLASVLILKEIDGGVFEKYCSHCKVEDFHKLNFEVWLHLLQTSPGQSF